MRNQRFDQIVNPKCKCKYEMVIKDRENGDNLPFELEIMRRRGLIQQHE